jgi:hypothetical protein
VCSASSIDGCFARHGDGDKINAIGKDGVLTVTIPKQAKATPRRIQIRLKASRVRRERLP